MTLLTTSLRVMIPQASSWVRLSTTRLETFFSRISFTASATVASGETVTTSLVITSAALSTFAISFLSNPASVALRLSTSLRSALL